MEAKDYYDKYRPMVDVYSPELVQLRILSDFHDELKALCRQRGEHPAIRQSIIRELNDKWNTVAHLFMTCSCKAGLEMNAFAHSVYKGDAARARTTGIACERLADWKHHEAFFRT